ncbi:MAG: substrate-binding domain-containing protein [Clostridiales Family XIII bacterium]|jgi:tungstate transport system substrate-binding protein|nr:substrate-binding domain-containing protein [Clostridiales Family XIII bacterium]
MKKNKFMKIGIASLLVLTLVAATFLGACGDKKSGGDPTGETSTEEKQVEPKGTFRLATTTSTKDSGLLEYILPIFQKSTGWEADVISVGSGEALAMGRNGEADVLLVHSPADEDTFVDEGNADATGKVQIMYNDFVLIGPKTDPAGINAAGANDAVKAFKAVADQKAAFISRGDESGTHKKELKIWDTAGITPTGDWYTVANAGMADVIAMANEKLGYTLADRSTWLAKQQDTDLAIVSEKDPSGVYNNQYSVICVNPDKNDQIKHDAAVAFQEWMASADGQKAIGEFGVTEYGQQLFTPNAA